MTAEGPAAAAGEERRKLLLVGALLVLAQVAFLQLARMWGARFLDGVRVQQWSSDDMMQLLPSAELKSDPFGQLLYLHKHPPLVDALRAVLVQLSPYDAGPELRDAIDVLMYGVWAALAGVIALLVFAWVRELVSSRAAVVATLLWIVHPSPIFVATLLDGTLPSAVCSTWLVYELVRIDDRDPPSLPWRAALAAALAIYTRSIFQWYFIPFFGAALLLRSRRPRTALVGTALALALSLPLFVKQELLFDTSSTSTFGGYHYCGLFWVRPAPDDVKRALDELPYRYPPGAPPTVDRFNTEKQARDHLVLGQLCAAAVKEEPGEALRALAWSVRQNFTKALGPTSRADPHVLLDHIPWRAPFDWLFSGVALLVLVGATLLWQRARFVPRWTARRATAVIGAYLVPLYILGFLLIANRYEWVESDRLKFMLEPALYVFTFAAVWTWSSRLGRWRASQGAITRVSTSSLRT